MGSIPSLNPLYLLEGDGPEHWVKPVPNTIKINVDESEEKLYGYAYVVLDENGFLLEAAVKVCSSDR